MSLVSYLLLVLMIDWRWCNPERLFLYLFAIVKNAWALRLSIIISQITEGWSHHYIFFFGFLTFLHYFMIRYTKMYNYQRHDIEDTSLMKVKTSFECSNLRFKKNQILRTVILGFGIERWYCNDDSFFWILIYHYLVYNQNNTKYLKIY